MGSLPPGFRFHPTDEELVGYYLKKKVEGEEIELEVIPVIDFYKYDPWDLPDKSFLPRKDMEWFFFSPRDKKYPNGSRTNRATRAGYWKATGKERKVLSDDSIIGYRKTLVFYHGRAPLGDRTNWVMQEYRLSEDHSRGSQDSKGVFTLCRVVKKAEVKSGSSTLDLASSRTTNEALRISSEPQMSSHHSTPISSPFDMARIGEFDASPMWVSPEFILDSSKEYSQGQEAVLTSLPQYEHQDSMFQWQPYNQHGISPSSSYSNFNGGEIENLDDLSRMELTGYYGNEDVRYGSYDQFNPYIGPF